MIEDQKIYYAGPISRAFELVHLDYSSFVFCSRISPIIRLPGPTFSVLCLRSCLPFIITVLGLGSNIQRP